MPAASFLRNWWLLACGYAGFDRRKLGLKAALQLAASLSVK